MFIFVLIIHILACLLLIGIILIQSGRGGGLVESFSGVESMLGTKTSAFLTRLTTVLAVIFITTCLTLALLSIQRGKSVTERIKIPVAEPAEKSKEAQEEKVIPSDQATMEQKAVSAESNQTTTP
ncbi:MAG: preprotein translocase subunit SecG [Candidatus Omnitrophica bacterium]|nr:preprotein translocase subunit SecG [Candidatus Omnitrophota bacterium]MCM8770721.1 preprotein translocase subunit SecG [Candidatus Omnitrophota bacterium]